MCCQNVVLQCKLIDEGVIWSLKAFWELLYEEGRRLGEQQVHTTCPPQNVEVENILLGVPQPLFPGLSSSPCFFSLTARCYTFQDPPLNRRLTYIYSHSGVRTNKTKTSISLGYVPFNDVQRLMFL